MRKSTIVARFRDLANARSYAETAQATTLRPYSVTFDAVSGGWLVLRLEDEDA